MDSGLPARMLRAAGADFPFTETGAGRPVVFVHGALGDHRTWRAACAALGQRARAIAYTQRWFGATDWPADGPGFGTGTHGADLAAFCAALDAGPVAVVAWSYGGHAALLAARDRPELFSALLVHEPGMPSWVSDETELAAFGADLTTMFPTIFAAAATGDLAQAARLVIEGSGGAGAFDRLSPEQRGIVLDNAHTMPLLLAQEPAPPITADALAACRVPLTFAWGEKTRPAFAIPARAAAGLVGGDRHRQVPGTGHLWPIQDPEGFAAMVGAWLDETG